VVTNERLSSSHRTAHRTAERVATARGHVTASANGGIPPRASEDTHVPIQEQYDEVRQLIARGKRKGYLLYEEVNELLPSDVTSSDELDELFGAPG
jgi:hypothetical protein